MFENGSFLRRRRRFKITPDNASLKEDHGTSDSGFKHLSHPGNKHTDSFKSFCHKTFPVPASPLSQPITSPMYNTSLSPVSQHGMCNANLQHMQNDFNTNIAAYYQMLFQYYSLLGMNWNAFQDLNTTTSLFNSQMPLSLNSSNFKLPNDFDLNSAKLSPISMSSGTSSPTSAHDSSALDLRLKH